MTAGNQLILQLSIAGTTKVPQTNFADAYAIVLFMLFYAGKVISIFTVCGAIASDCVSQGHTGFLPLILDMFEESCSKPVLDQYLKNMKGWVGY